jgi:hypothetical protein
MDVQSFNGWTPNYLSDHVFVYSPLWLQSWYKDHISICLVTQTYSYIKIFIFCVPSLSSLLFHHLPDFPVIFISALLSLP